MKSTQIVTNKSSIIRMHSRFMLMPSAINFKICIEFQMLSIVNMYLLHHFSCMMPL